MFHTDIRLVTALIGTIACVQSVQEYVDLKLIS